jgi:flagellar biosynthetic protein FliR
MSLEQALNLVPAFVLVFFRVAGMCLAAPLFGSSRIPMRIKLMFALVLALGVMPTVSGVTALPESAWQLALGIGGEMVFGLAIGTALNFVFVAAHWAGDIIGQQMGLGMGQVYDPQFGQSGSAVSDMYFLLTLVLFMAVGGHYAFLRGVAQTFESLPLLSPGMDVDMLQLVVGLLTGATTLAMQLAAPVLLTAMIADVVLGFLSKTVPQLNVMTAGLSIRAMAGMVVLMFGMTLSSEVIQASFLRSVTELSAAWKGIVS